jgi:hypothetical protein
LRRAVDVEGELLDRDGRRVLMSVTKTLHRGAPARGRGRHLLDQVVGTRDRPVIEREERVTGRKPPRDAGESGSIAATMKPFVVDRPSALASSGAIGRLRS